MSALPPKADSGRHEWHVRFGPIVGIGCRFVIATYLSTRSTLDSFALCDPDDVDKITAAWAARKYSRVHPKSVRFLRPNSTAKAAKKDALIKCLIVVKSVKEPRPLQSPAIWA